MMIKFPLVGYCPHTATVYFEGHIRAWGYKYVLQSAGSPLHPGLQVAL